MSAADEAPTIRPWRPPRQGGRWYPATIPFRLIAMVVVGLLDIVLLWLALVMSLSATAADIVLSPRHWRERKSYVAVPRPWQLPAASKEMVTAQWRHIVGPSRPQPSPSERWP